MSSEGRKDDSGKDRWSLLPWDAVREVVKVLTFGAKKYSRHTQLENATMLAYLKEELCKHLSVPAVNAKIEKSTVEDCVELVTIRRLKQATLNMPCDKKKTPVNGQSATGSALSNTALCDCPTQKKESAIERLTEEIGSSGTMVLRSKNTTYLCEPFLLARSADECSKRTIVILTMTMQQTGCEEFFVIVATEESECLEILSSVLSELFATYKRPLRETSGWTLHQSGKDNWQFVPDARIRYEDALERHLVAWRLGERLDPESGLNHLAHAGCCLLFLLWFDIKRKE